MFTFAAKPRILRLREGSKVTLPGPVTISARFAPSWVFGGATDGSRMAIHASVKAIHLRVCL